MAPAQYECNGYTTSHNSAAHRSSCSRATLTARARARQSKTHEAERVSHHLCTNSLLPELDKTLKPTRRSCRRMYRACRSFTSVLRKESIAEPLPPPMPAVSREIPDSILEHRYYTLQRRQVRSLWIMTGRLLLSHARWILFFPSLACLTLPSTAQAQPDGNSGENLAQP
jgi:hypothetical protein